MRRRVVGLRAGAAGCVVAMGLMWWPTPAGAEGDVEVGWWYRLSGESTPAAEGGDPAAEEAKAAPPPTLPPTPVPVPTAPPPTLPGEEDPPAAPAPVPPPASVPDGGIYVANDAFGPLAIGAVRFAVGQVGETTLTLRFADGAGGASTPIVACPLLEGFQAVTNGAWRDRPAHDCGRAKASGTVGTDGTLTFALSAAFQQAGQQTLDVVLLPTPGEGSPFSAPFQAVGPGDLAIRTPAPARPVPTTSPGFTLDPEAPAASYNGGGAPRRPQTTGRVPTPVATAPTSTTETAATPARESSGAVQPVAELFEDRPWARWVATTLLGGLAVGMTAVSTGRIPALAGATTGRDKGVGRFARHRDGPPPPLT